MKKILLISGLDPSGNAGLLRDLEIVSSFPLKPSAVVTALTAQNTKKFIAVQTVSPAVFRRQLESVLPLSQFNAVKIGMLGDEKIVQVLCRILKAQKRRPPIILDPVLESSTKGILLTKRGRRALCERLISLVDLWTPNTTEASFFWGRRIVHASDMEQAAEALWQAKKIPILIKGGHLTRSTRKARSGLKGEKVQDLFFDGSAKTWFIFGRYHVGAHCNVPLRGTGCALSTLIASFLAEGFPLGDAVKEGRITMDSWITKQFPV